MTKRRERPVTNENDDQRARKKDEWNDYLRSQGYTAPERVTSSNGQNRYIEGRKRAEGKG